MDNKKTVTIWFEGMSENFKIEYFYPLNLLKKHYEVIITNKNPQYIFCSNFNNYSFCKYEGVRIFFDCECYFPNFNIVDYALLTCLNFNISNRCVHWSPYLTVSWRYEKLKNRNFSFEDIHKKEKFCNYIYSHDNLNIRTSIFQKLNDYKHVDSAGNYLNNLNGWHPGTRADATPGSDSLSKYNFQKYYKFTIAYENFSYPSYNTEKIIDAFAAGTIPIYWGDPDIIKIFNPKAFINAMDYETLDDLINKIREIDLDDRLFLSMLNEPVFKENNFLDRSKKEIDDFILNIFKQDYRNAFRRPLYGLGMLENIFLRKISNYLKIKDFIHAFILIAYKPIRILRNFIEK